MRTSAFRLAKQGVSTRNLKTTGTFQQEGTRRIPSERKQVALAHKFQRKQDDRREKRLLEDEPLGQYILTLDISEDLQTQITAVRDVQNSGNPLDQPEARAYLFRDILPESVDRMKDLLPFVVNKAHKFEIKANDVRISNVDVKVYVGPGKNELGNMMGKMKERLQRRKPRILKTSQEHIYGNMIHWLILKDKANPKRVQNCGMAVKDAFTNAKGIALGLKLWNRPDPESPELVEVGKWEFRKPVKPLKVLHSERITQKWQ